MHRDEMRRQMATRSSTASGCVGNFLRCRVIPSVTFFGSLVILIGLVSVAGSQHPSVNGDPGSLANGITPVMDLAGACRVGSAGDMIGFSHSDGSGTQTITVVHTGKSWMAVYHIDRSGTIRLVSSRPIDADFSLQLNATSPLPEEIRQLSRR